MAYYDPNTDKIVGAELGSPVWFHEDRHKQQFNNTSLQRKVVFCEVLGFYGRLILVASAFFRALDNPLFDLLFFLSVVLVIPDIYFTAWLELDAESYSKRMVRDCSNEVRKI